jgi:hypothetical protein
MITVSERYQAPEAEPEAPYHAHHWLIAGQQGPVSPAVCKLCGCDREFSNGFVRSWGWPLKSKTAQAIHSRVKEATVVGS